MERRLIGIDELATYLDLSKNTLYSWVCQRRIPYCKIGRLVKFDLRKIDDWLKKQNIETFKFK